MNRTRLNLVLLVVAAALGVAVYFGQKAEPKGPPLTTLTPDAVTKISIAHPRAAEIRLEKQDGHWRLVAPVTAPADALEIAALTALADRETKQTLDAAQIKLADLTLDPPDFTLTLNDQRVDFGSVEPLQYRRYVKTGAGVFLIEDPPATALDADYADLVAKELFAEAAQIDRIELPKLTLAKTADGKWSLKPADPKASADQMQRLADFWKTARSMWNERPKGLARQKGDLVRVRLKDGAIREFLVTERDPQFKLYEADTGIVHTLSKSLEEQMLKLPAPAAETKPEAAEPAPAMPPAAPPAEK